MIREQIAFAMRIPPAKLAARVKLMVKRRLLAAGSRRGLVGTSGLASAAEPVSAEPPTALFPIEAAVEALPGGFAFCFLNHREEFQLPIDWHRSSLQTGTRLWLLNLHYMEYLSALSDEAFHTILEDWIEGNPRYAPNYWTYNWNSYSLSIRVVSIMNELVRRGERLEPAFVDLVLRSLVKQLLFLERNIESDIGGNHIVKNVKALLWGGAFFHGQAAQRWTQKGEELLGRALPLQILGDGFHYELSPSYHAQVFADLLEIRGLLPSPGLKDRLDEVLRRMEQPLADMTHPDGTPALFGDAGLSMSYAPGLCMDIIRSAGRPPVEPRPLFAFPDAGYYGLRSSRYYLVADMGEVAPDDLPAHGHGDVGSFELSVAGKRMIVDPGVYDYSAGDRRSRSRSAAAHNVLHVHGGDQAEFFGAFRCGRRPAVDATFSPCADGRGFILEGSHDGYAAVGVERTVRRFEAGADGFTIHDRVEAGRRGRASISMLLHPDAVPSMSDGRLSIRRDGGECVVQASEPIVIEDDVWWPDLGVERRTRRLRLDIGQERNEAWCRFEIGSRGAS